VPETADALQKHYKDIPQFPQTPEKYDDTSPVTSGGDIFTLPDGLKSLPIVGFPDSTIASAKVETAGLGFLSGIRALFSGATRTRSESVQIKIPEAETYGVGAEEALRLLTHFCSASPSCTNAGARAALSLPRDEEERISIRFITRVYLTRSIDYHYGSDTAVAAAVRAALDRSATNQPPAPAASPGAAPPTGTPQQILESARTQAIRELEGLGQGGQLTSASVTSAGAVLKMQFARPVAIGYQCLSISPYPDPEAAKPEATNDSKASAR